MGIVKDKLDVSWTQNKSDSTVFDFRATAQNAKNVIDETLSKMEEIIGSDAFDSADADIKTEAKAVQSTLQKAQTDLENHFEFLNWTQPE